MFSNPFSSKVIIFTSYSPGRLACWWPLPCWDFCREKRKTSRKPCLKSGQFTRQGLLLGLLAIFAGGLPVWLIGRQVIQGGNADRFSLAPMFGVVILVVCLLNWLAGQSKRQNLVLAVLLGLSIATQVSDVNAAGSSWQAQRQFYWQLYWRAPALKPGTLVLGQENLVINYFALNILYSPRLDPTQASYWYYQTFPLGTRPDKPISHQLRNIQFNGSASAILAVTFRDDLGCLKVLDPSMITNPGLVDFEPQYAAFSNLGQIETSPAQAVTPPAEIFGREPPHDWCYYYEKAALASQIQDWNTVASLAQQAAQAGLDTHYGTELIPFIEGYAHLAQWQPAYQYTRQALHIDGNRYYPFMCALWQTLNDEMPAAQDKEEAVTNLNHSLGCTIR